MNQIIFVCALSSVLYGLSVFCTLHSERIHHLLASQCSKIACTSYLYVPGDCMTTCISEFFVGELGEYNVLTTDCCV